MTTAQLNSQNQLGINYSLRIKARQISTFALHFFIFVCINILLVFINHKINFGFQWSLWVSILWLIGLVSHFYLSFLALPFERFIYKRISIR
jgi:2TM domain